MTHSLWDFRKVEPTRERLELRWQLLNAEDTYFDPETDSWISESRYTPEDANYVAQSMHRYRLISFSNFLTTVLDFVQKLAEL